MILAPERASRWLAMDDAVLADYPSIAPRPKAWPASRRVNSPGNNDDNLIEATGETLAG